MLEERTIHLINADIDGELGPGEREDLEAILESSPEARAMRAELLRLSNLLDSVPEQSPPPGLSQQVLNQITPPPGGAAGLYPVGLFRLIPARDRWSGLRCRLAAGGWIL